MHAHRTDLDITEYDLPHTAIGLAEYIVVLWILPTSLSVLFSLPATQLLLFTPSPINFASILMLSLPEKGTTPIIMSFH